MSEISGPNFSVNKLGYTGIQKQNAEVPEAVVSEDVADKITDFSDNKAEALGRSMLFKGTDGLNHDLKVLLENPQIAENSDKMFDIAYNAAVDAGVENPYEEAATASTVSM